MEKSIETLDLGVNTHTDKLHIQVYDTYAIENVVGKIEGAGTISAKDIKSVYISEHRVCIELNNGIEFSIPVSGTKLFDKVNKK